MAVAKKYQGEPIIFIGVNSGTNPKEIASYLRGNDINWPVIADVDRTFEKQAGVGIISLQNIWAARIITGDGKMVAGNANDLAETAERAAAGAEWNVDPKEIPEALQQAWFAVEFGNFPAAAAILKKNLKSGNADLKTGAEKLNAFVQQRLQQQLDAAKNSLDQQKPWEAYKAYSSIPASFKGYEIPDDVAAQIKSLGTDEVVKQELAAVKAMNSVQKALASSSASSQRRAASMLKKLIDDFPGTDGAKAAQELLNQENEAN